MSLTVSIIDGDDAALRFEDGSFDGVAIVQVLEHLEDPAAVLAEVHRVLRPGGRVVVVDTDWRSCVWDSDDRERADRVLRTWESRFQQPHLPGRLPALLRDRGFGEATAEVLPIATPQPARMSSAWAWSARWPRSLPTRPGSGPKRLGRGRETSAVVLVAATTSSR